jgi:hypothetical protein
MHVYTHAQTQYHRELRNAPTLALPRRSGREWKSTFPPPVAGGGPGWGYLRTEQEKNRSGRGRRSN